MNTQQSVQEKIAMAGWGSTLPKPATQVVVAQAKVKKAPASENSTPNTPSTPINNNNNKSRRFTYCDDCNLTGKEILSLDCNMRVRKDMIFKNDLRAYFSECLGFRSEPRLMLLAGNVPNYENWKRSVKELGNVEKRPDVEAEFVGHFIGKSSAKWADPMYVIDEFEFEGVPSGTERYLIEEKSTIYPKGNEKLNELSDSLEKAKKDTEKAAIKKKIDNTIRELIISQAKGLAYRVNHFSRAFEERIPINMVYVLKDYSEKEEKEYVRLFLDTFLDSVRVKELKSLTVLNCEPEFLKEHLLEVYKEREENSKKSQTQKKETKEETKELSRKVISKFSNEKEDYQQLITSW